MQSAVWVGAGLVDPGWVGADLSWWALEASGVQSRPVGSQSHVPWEVDNPYAQHMSYPSVEQLAFPDMMP